MAKPVFFADTERIRIHFCVQVFFISFDLEAFFFIFSIESSRLLASWVVAISLLKYLEDILELFITSLTV